MDTASFRLTTDMLMMEMRPEDKLPKDAPKRCRTSWGRKMGVTHQSDVVQTQRMSQRRRRTPRCTEKRGLPAAPGGRSSEMISSSSWPPEGTVPCLFLVGHQRQVWSSMGLCIPQALNWGIGSLDPSCRAPRGCVPAFGVNSTSILPFTRFDRSWAQAALWGSGTAWCPRSPAPAAALWTLFGSFLQNRASCARQSSRQRTSVTLSCREDSFVGVKKCSNSGACLGCQGNNGGYPLISEAQFLNPLMILFSP